MNTPPSPARPIVRVIVPVVVAVALIALAVVNVFVVRNWIQVAPVDDGVLWSADLRALEVSTDSAAETAGLRRGDFLLAIDGRSVATLDERIALLAQVAPGQIVSYLVSRDSEDDLVTLQLVRAPGPNAGLYYLLAAVGIFGLLVGTSVRLRRPADPATLHFFWLTTAFFGVFAFTYTGEFTRSDYFFYWTDVVAFVALPPLFLHFALIFPDRPNAWIASPAGRAMLPLLYAPAAALALARLAAMRWLPADEMVRRLVQVETVEFVYLSACLLGGLALMIRALGRLRSVTARRQLRWIVWGSGLGAVPFVLAYVIPFLVGVELPYGEYTAVLLGCIPLAFASAIVRYRLMDVEVIIKRALVVSAVGLVLVVIYQGTLELVSVISGHEQQQNEFWALFATLVVVLVATPLWNAIQGGLDRLYYRDRYDYRRALVTFARELNSDLDLERLSSRLVERVGDTLAVDRLALLLASPEASAGAFTPVATRGVEAPADLRIETTSDLGSRLLGGHTVSIDDPVPIRRLTGDESAAWRDAGWHAFVPCVSKEITIGVLAIGRRARHEPLSSEDMALLGAVAGQAATALENARLYGQLRVKAEEIERLRQFADSVVESLSDGLLVIDLDDRVLRWNRRLEQLLAFDRSRAIGRRMGGLFPEAFVEALLAARRESPEGATLHRMPLAAGPSAELPRPLIVNAGIAPFQTADGDKAGWIVVIEDVTDRANLEEQLRLSEKMAAVGLLAAGVAHEVNTPLTGISSFTQMLLEQADPEDPRTQLLEKIERQTFRAAKIVNSLLNLARPSGGESAPVDINLVINDVLSLLEHQFRNSRIQVRRELAASGHVQGLEYKLQQVFLNLFLNARDSMPKGGWLSVATRSTAEGVVVEVSDTGGGIPSEHIARIYDPFFTTKGEGVGTGLGLSVTYGIVQEHGGTLTCDSAIGQGTRFTVALPGVHAAGGAVQAQ